MAGRNERLRRDNERRKEDRLSAVRGKEEATSLSVKECTQMKGRKREEDNSIKEEGYHAGRADVSGKGLSLIWYYVSLYWH